MKKVNVYGRIVDGGDGSFSIHWYLSAAEVEDAREEDDDYSDSEPEKVQTYVGSNVHNEAVNNREEAEGNLDVDDITAEETDGLIW